jgi:hypothetical protein
MQRMFHPYVGITSVEVDVLFLSSSAPTEANKRTKRAFLE